MSLGATWEAEEGGLPVGKVTWVRTNVCAGGTGATQQTGFRLGDFASELFH